MKLVFTVPDSYESKITNLVWHATRFRDEGDAELITVAVKIHGENRTFGCSDIEITDLPKFKVGDVVENTKSGNWGKIHSINADAMLIIHTSKKTFEETGMKVMEFHPSEAEHLV